MSTLRFLFAALLPLAGLDLGASGPVLAQDAPIDAFLCRQVGRSDGATAPAARVVDHFADETVATRRPSRLCEPVALAGRTVLDAEVSLTGHRTRTSPRQPRRHDVPVETELGAKPLDLHRTAMLLVPSSSGSEPTPPPDPEVHPVDAYRCYRAHPGDRSIPTPPSEVEVARRDGSTRRLTLGAPRLLCSPAEVDDGTMHHPSWHLACFSARPAGRASEAIHDLAVTSELGTQRIDVVRERELCLPATALPGCNGSPALCGRRFDEVAYATTHNAMSNVADGFIGPNQQLSVRGQLEDGVRGLMLDIHYDAGEVALCHAFCSLGRTPLVETLGEIRDFLRRHPYEVVTIIFESYVSGVDAGAAFAAAGLLDLVHTQTPGAPWPTLAEMIASGRRLVVFTDHQGGTSPWYHHVWAHAFETHYSWATPESMNCNPNRGDPQHPLFILNHFLTNVFGSPALAAQVNYNPFFLDRALQCQAERGALPNFVTVDFHDIGDVFPVVDALNR